MTTYAQMLELSDPMDCSVRDLGEGSIRVLMWGSVNANPQCWVRLYGSGRMVVVDQSDLTVQGNPGDARDVPPKQDGSTMTLDNGMVITLNPSER